MHETAMTPEAWIVLLTFFLGGVAGALLVSIETAADMARIHRNFERALVERIERRTSLNDPKNVQNPYPRPESKGGPYSQGGSILHERIRNPSV
jgi:hypothetical protein